MALRFAFVLLFAIAFGNALPFPPTKQCGEHAEFRSCASACEPTCANPHPGPVCTLQCVIGCFCTEGYLMNSAGVCVRPSECDAAHAIQPIAEAMIHERRPVRCAVNEEFKQCRGCDSTCFGDVPCPKICLPGCACKEGHVRMDANGNGPCIPVHQCPQIDPPVMLEVKAAVDSIDGKCVDNELFNPCGSACAPTCQNPHPSPVCTKNCVIGCYCKPGHLRNNIGVCVPAETCVAQETPREKREIETPKCPANEFFHPCGSACAPSCKNPDPSPVCTKQCVIGCFCKPGHLRNNLGVCVPAENCVAQETPREKREIETPKCPANEFFHPCGSACAPSCKDPHPSPVCTKQCVIGCFCKPGFLREENGDCVEALACKSQPAVEMMMLPPPICKEDEVMRPCHLCDATCDNLNPICKRVLSLRHCRPGCSCKEGLVRNAEGRCIPQTQCPNTNTIPVSPASVESVPEKKCGVNEQFSTCGSACPPTCARRQGFRCTLRCMTGCFCKPGYFKNSKNVCVMEKDCENTPPFLLGEDGH